MHTSFALMMPAVPRVSVTEQVHVLTDSLSGYPCIFPGQGQPGLLWSQEGQGLYWPGNIGASESVPGVGAINKGQTQLIKISSARLGEDRRHCSIRSVNWTAINTPRLEEYSARWWLFPIAPIAWVRRRHCLRIWWRHRLFS